MELRLRACIITACKFFLSSTQMILISMMNFFSSKIGNGPGNKNILTTITKTKRYASNDSMNKRVEESEFEAGGWANNDGRNNNVYHRRSVG